MKATLLLKSLCLLVLLAGLTSFAADKPKIGEIKLITDEELFALFPGRSVALIGKPGHQQLVFLNNQTQAPTDQEPEQEKPF
jgi:hypothetical protein